MTMAPAYMSHEEEYCNEVELSCMVDGQPLESRNAQTEMPIESSYVPDMPWREFQEELKKRRVLTNWGVKQILPEVLQNGTESRIKQHFYNSRNGRRVSMGSEPASDLKYIDISSHSNSNKARRRGSTGSLFVNSFIAWRS
mmetsp:Transcript_10939/g.16120  ORF Transcript_10939/g.16120 Transcript_10939/m.16120 type:complete len:141 (+) Transcript_10939:198-620(+)